MPSYLYGPYEKQWILEDDDHNNQFVAPIHLLYEM